MKTMIRELYEEFKIDLNIHENEIRTNKIDWELVNKIFKRNNKIMHVIVNCTPVFIGYVKNLH